MIKKAQQYGILKVAIESGRLELMKDIPSIVPITVLTVDMKLNYSTLSKRLLDPARFTVKDIYRLAALIGIEPDVLFQKIGQELIQPG
jgi:hypothetical protein